MAEPGHGKTDDSCSNQNADVSVLAQPAEGLAERGWPPARQRRRGWRFTRTLGTATVREARQCIARCAHIDASRISTEGGNVVLCPLEGQALIRHGHVSYIVYAFVYMFVDFQSFLESQPANE